MSTAPQAEVTSEVLDQMYEDAVAGCRAVWKTIDQVRKSGCQIYVEVHPDRLIVKSLKGQQLVWIDAASSVDYSSWQKSAVPAQGEIDPDSTGEPSTASNAPSTQ